MQIIKLYKTLINNDIPLFLYQQKYFFMRNKKEKNVICLNKNTL